MIEPQCHRWSDLCGKKTANREAFIQIVDYQIHDLQSTFVFIDPGKHKK